MYKINGCETVQKYFNYDYKLKMVISYLSTQIQNNLAVV